MDERRYHGLDSLRGSLMLLGIVLHSSMFYVVKPPLPLPTDHNTSYLFDGLLLFIHSFRMQAFFVLAGFFASLLVAKRGIQGAFVDRMRRVLAPLIVCSVTILPVTGLLSVYFLMQSRYGDFDFVPDQGLLRTAIQERVSQGIPLDQPSLAHLWFLEYLCLFYLLIPLCMGLVDWLRQAQSRVDAFLQSPFAIVALGFLTAIQLLPFRGGQVQMENTLLIPHLPSLVLFGSFFVLGYVFHNFRGFLPSLARRCALWAALAGVLTPLAGYAYLSDAGTSVSQTTHLAAAIFNGFLTWSLIFLSMGVALRHFDRESPWTQYAAQSAYWVYLVHLPAICLSALWLLQFDIPAIFKFAINCAFAFVIAFASFHYWVQNSWIGAFLHGRRFRLCWPWLSVR